MSSSPHFPFSENPSPEFSSVADQALILSYYFPPMNGPGTQHPLAFHRYLPHYGIATHVLTSAYYGDENVDSTLDHIANTSYIPYHGPERLWRALFLAETKIQYRFGLYEHGILPWLPLAYRYACRWIREHGCTAIVSTSPPISNHLLAYRLKKTFPSLRWIADLQDPLVGNPFRKSKGRIRQWEERSEHKIFSLADAISANTDTVRALWLAKYPHWAAKFSVVWNGFDPAESVAALPLPARPQPTIAHVGALYGGRLPGPLFDSIYRLSRAGRLRSSDFKLDFTGSVSLQDLPNQQQIQTLIEEGWLSIRDKYVPRTEALRITAEADMTLLLDLTYPHNTKLQVPSKIYDYVRVGRPILAFTPENSPTERILRRSGIAAEIISSTATPEQVDEGLLRFLALPRAPQPASPWFLENFDARNLAGRVAKMIRGESCPDFQN